MKKRISRDHYFGCLLGGAVGDALGWPVEFLALSDIRKKFGQAGISGLVDAPGGVGAITDDTQLTLFTAEGLISAHISGKRGGGDAAVYYVHQAYLRWLVTQGEDPIKTVVKDRTGIGLVNADRLHNRRAPGKTCLEALKSGKIGSINNPLNQSKGCGGVMRMAPVGLYLALCATVAGREYQQPLAFKLGCQLAAITHGDPSGYLPAGCLASIIFALACGSTLPSAIIDTLKILKGWEGSTHVANLLELALYLWGSNELPEPEAIMGIGEGWMGDEALAISLYCALASGGDFSRGVLLAVNHDGDSDSTGSITGNILGLLLGMQAIPKPWLEQLELSDVIREVASYLLYLDGYWCDVVSGNGLG